jgi:hypothetical protein
MSERILPLNHKSMTFCYDTNDRNWTSYYLVPDAPKVVAPLEHRPTWKGQSGTPNTPPPTLLLTPEISRPSFGGDDAGFIPHHAEFKYFQSAIDTESSLRNLDNRLSNGTSGQRILTHLSNPSVQKQNLILLPHFKTKAIASYEGEYSTCGLPRKYAVADGMNGARFNNSTRVTTRNLILPYTKVTTRAAINQGRPGYVPS